MWNKIQRFATLFPNFIKKLSSSQEVAPTFHRTLVITALGSVGYSLIFYYGRKLKNNYFRMGVAGALATSMVEIPIYFIDTINMRSKNIAVTKNFREVFQYMLKKEGIFSFYRGFSTIILLFPGLFINFCIYDFMRDYLRDKVKNPKHVKFTSFFAALIADVFAFWCWYPVDLIKTRVQVPEQWHSYASPFEGIRKMSTFKEKKLEKTKKTILLIRRFYAGSSGYFFLILVFYTLEFGCYDFFMRIFPSFTQTQFTEEAKKKPPSIKAILVCSSLAATITSIMTNVMETVCVKRQINPSLKYRKILLEHNFWQLLKQGLLARVLYNVFQSGIMFVMLESFYTLFNANFTR